MAQTEGQRLSQAVYTAQSEEEKEEALETLRARGREILEREQANSDDWTVEDQIAWEVRDAREREIYRRVRAKEREQQ